MKSYYKGFYAFCAAAVAGAFGLFTSCTNVDDSVGGNLMPGGGEHMSLHIDTLGLSQDEVIKVYQTYTDSIGRRGSTRNMRGAMNINVGYLGSEVDAFFGKTHAASLFTAMPVHQSRPNVFMNKHESVDSVKLILNMKVVSGDESKKQTFNIYRLKDSLAYSTDTLYYQSIRYENHIEEQPLFSFEYSGKPADIDEIKLNILDNGRKFLDEFMAADTTIYYSGKTSEFLKKFKGFVIATAPGSPEDAAIYANYLPNTYMNFYFQRDREQWEIDEDTKDKSKTITAYAQWYMSESTTGINTSVASIRHDFSGTKFDGVQNGKMVEASQQAYIRGLGGVTATLEFGDGFFESIEKLKPSSDYAVYVNQAQMFVWVKDQTTEAYDKSFQKLGSYIDYGPMDVIADYYIYDSSSDTTSVPYDGSLNRNTGKGYYSMDITSFMQHAILNKDEESRRLTLAPTYNPYQPFSEGLTTLQTHGSDHPVMVKLTYTLINKANK